MILKNWMFKENAQDACVNTVKIMANYLKVRIYADDNFCEVYIEAEVYQAASIF